MTTTNATPSPRDRLLALRDAMRDMFPERNGPIDGLLMALLTAAHCLLLGLPGTAKSAMTEVICSVFEARFFNILMGKFTTPEDLYGPLDVPKLQQGVQVRDTEGMMPEADIAFLDEVFKGGDSINNTNLKTLNERLYRNGKAWQKCPLITCVGASNELPENKGLNAFWDRFLFKYDVAWLTLDGNFEKMLFADEPHTDIRITLDELRAMQAEVKAVTVSRPAKEAIKAIRSELRSQGFAISDRCWKAAVKAIKANAWMQGESEATPEDLNILCDIVWSDPAQRPKIAAVVGKLADPLGAQIQAILDAARECVVRVSALRSGDQKAWVQAAAGANQDLQQQIKALDKLAPEASKRNLQAIEDAKVEIKTCKDDFARAVAVGMNLRAAS